MPLEANTEIFYIMIHLSLYTVSGFSAI